MLVLLNMKCTQVAERFMAKTEQEVDRPQKVHF